MNKVYEVSHDSKPHLSKKKFEIQTNLFYWDEQQFAISLKLNYNSFLNIYTTYLNLKDLLAQSEKEISYDEFFNVFVKDFDWEYSKSDNFFNLTGAFQTQIIINDNIHYIVSKEVYTPYPVKAEKLEPQKKSYFEKTSVNSTLFDAEKMTKSLAFC